MRSIQRRLPWQPMATARQAPHRRSSETAAVTARTDQVLRRREPAWSGLEDACTGWIPVRRVVSGAGSDVVSAGDSARLQEWIDLVAGRIGSGCVRRASALMGEREACLGVAPQGRDSRLEETTDLAVHLGRRPSQLFMAEEIATIVGGGMSSTLAACIAERRAWCAQTRNDRQPTAASTPVLRWRGRIWALCAIDGWERAAGRWWEQQPDQQTVRGSDRSRDPESALVDRPDPAKGEGAVARSMGRAAVIARLSGRLYARVQIGTGLWLFARFPDRIAPLHPIQHESAIRAFVPDQRDTCEGAPRLERCGQERCGQDHFDQGHFDQGRFSHRHQIQNEPFPRDAWLDRCERVFDAGLVISILGAWG